ncbi:MAG TPA: LytR C-terminal domain-containing protein [Balneolaceae bacterium]|nr:LytR C-terminal domain-containing protein [Balneolaceae bacterium]
MTQEDSSNTFALNSIIGFLGLLLCLLLFGLFSRLVYPRIQNKRAANSNKLIGNVIQVAVLNGCGAHGIADKITTKLRHNGFDVVRTGNFKNFNMKHTTVISRTPNKTNAEKVAKALGVAKSHVLVESSHNYYLDATIVIGSDYHSLKLN